MNTIDKKRDIKFGIVGCGDIANIRHIPDLLKIKHVDVCAVCDINKDRALETSQNFGISHYYTSFETMLERSDINAIDICTPPKTHAMLGLKAINAGYHVLIEKPMALRVEECDKLISAANKMGVKLCIIHNHLFNPAVQKARYLVDAEYIGKLVDVDVKFYARRDICLVDEDHWTHDLPGGIFGETAPHPVYLCRTFLPKIRSIKVIPKKIRSHPRMPFDELNVLLDGENAVGRISVSANSPFPYFVIDIRGTDRVLHVEPHAQRLVIHSARKEGLSGFAKAQISIFFQISRNLFSVSAKYLTGSYRSGTYFLIQRFVESVQDDKEVPVTGEEGRETVKILEKIWNQLDKYQRSKENFT